MALTINGVEFVSDPPDAWRKVAQCIDRAYQSSWPDYEPNKDLSHYVYCGKQLENMTYQECVAALARFKIPCDDLSGSKQSRDKSSV